MKCIVWWSYFLIFCEAGREVYTVHWAGAGLRILILFLNYVPGCHAECFRGNCDIWWDFSPQCLCEKKGQTMSLGVNWQEKKTERDGGKEETGSCTVPSYVYIYTLHLRSVSKSNILKMDFVYYCSVQDSALNVLWLLLWWQYCNFFRLYYYNEDT